MAIWASDTTFLHQLCNKANIPNSGGFCTWRILNLFHPEKVIGSMRSLIKLWSPTVKWVRLFKSLIQLRWRLQSRWRNSRTQSSSVPINTSRIHVHLQQFSQNTYWTLAEVLKHLKGQEKSPYNWIRWKEIKRKWDETSALGRNLERRSFCTLGSPIIGKTISWVRKRKFRGSGERAKMGLW